MPDIPAQEYSIDLTLPCGHEIEVDHIYGDRLVQCPDEKCKLIWVATACRVEVIEYFVDVPPQPYRVPGQGVKLFPNGGAS